MDLHNWCDARRKERIEELVKFFGSATELARCIGVSPSTALSWHSRGSVSRSGAEKIEKATHGRFSAAYMYPSAPEFFLAERVEKEKKRNGKN